MRRAGEWIQTLLPPLLRPPENSGLSGRDGFRLECLVEARGYVDDRDREHMVTARSDSAQLRRGEALLRLSTVLWLTSFVLLGIAHEVRSSFVTVRWPWWWFAVACLLAVGGVLLARAPHRGPDIRFRFGVSAIGQASLYLAFAAIDVRFLIPGVPAAGAVLLLPWLGWQYPEGEEE